MVLPFIGLSEAKSGRFKDEGEVALAPIELLIGDLCLKKGTPDEFLNFLHRRIKQRKGLLHRCCRKLEFVDIPLLHIRKILKMVSLDCIQEVEEPEATQPKTKRGKVDHSRTVEKQPLAAAEVLLMEELFLNKAALDEFFTFVIKKVKQRKGLPLLYCRKLEFIDMPLLHITKILKMVQLDCVLEEVEKLVAQFTSQLLSLHQLQELHLDCVFFLKGHLDQVLRCLKTPLEMPLITNCWLLESNLPYLSSYPSTNHLRYLNLSDVNLISLSPEFLQVLLERASATLHRLELDGCGIADYELTAILPALGHCSQLTTFSFCANSVSMATLESLDLASSADITKFWLLLEK
ncbi:melanoma antigen preferentially expressed in tumors-like [Trichechus inunguis]